MSWVNELALEIEDVAIKQKERYRLLHFPDYWMNLRQQIEENVREINTHPYFAEILTEEKLTVVSAARGYQIIKNNFPSIVISVHHDNEIVHHNYKSQQHTKANVSGGSAIFSIESDGERIYLSNDKEAFLIPEQAAKRILSPVAAILRETLLSQT